MVLANRLPWPVDDGWKRRTYHVLRALTASAPVTLVTFRSGPEQEAEALSAALPGPLEVVQIGPSRVRRWLSIPLGVVTGTPFLTWRVRSPRFTEAVRRLGGARRYRLAIAELTHLYSHLRVLPEDCTRVIDTHNIDSLVMARYAGNRDRSAAWRWYAQRTAAQLREQEVRDFRHAHEVWVCSEGEAEWVLAHVPGGNARVVPNGVDPDAFRSESFPPAIQGRLVFFGRLDYHPNADGIVWFANEILPRIQAVRPDAELCIAGPGETPELSELASRHGIRLLGTVPDVRPVVASAAAVIVPLRSGGGTRLKILESLALGRPVITTAVGMEGLDLAPGRDLLVADGVDGFADAVLRVLTDRRLADALGESGRTSIARYDWRAIEHAISRWVSTRPDASPAVPPA